MRAMEPEERFERIERQLEFLAASQAQHDARMAEISRVQADNSRQITGNTEHIGQLADLTLRIGRIVEAQATRIDALTGRMDELAISQVRTDKRLNTLIQVAERYFSNGH
jgi:chromosome segregation ATPase